MALLDSRALRESPSRSVQPASTDLGSPGPCATWTAPGSTHTGRIGHLDRLEPVHHAARGPSIALESRHGRSCHRPITRGTVLQYPHLPTGTPASNGQERQHAPSRSSIRIFLQPPARPTHQCCAVPEQLVHGHRTPASVDSAETRAYETVPP